MSQRTLVLTVTPNPSLDLLFETDSLVWDDANRMPDPRRRPGGQGINVARAVRELGGSAVAVALIGGRTGDEIVSALLGEGLPIRSVPASGETRTFVGVREHGGGRSLLLNSQGPERAPADEAALMAAAEEELGQLKPHWLACCGSLPSGFRPDFHARLAQLGRRFGARVVVDCDGEPLRLAAPFCDLLVPNQHEAGRLISRIVRTPEEAIEALAMLPAPAAAITLGHDGAVFAADGASWRASTPSLQPHATVGAGDTFLAALLVALHHGAAPAEALRSATAAAAAALMSVGAVLLRREDADRLRDEVSVVQAG